MIKKYGIGMLALLIAVGLAAFITPKKVALNGTHVFQFNSALSYSVANVTDPNNWDYIGEISQQPMCQGSNKACRIAVTDDYVDDPSDPATLAGVTISAVLTSGTAKVTEITDDSVNNGFSNQP